MIDFFDPFHLAALPLSAYTPGQGDLKMEGGNETASGKPVYTFEAYLRGEAPYVTGATSNKNPSGQLVYRTIGDQQVPVRITDYGPGVKGIDIASSNRKWATNFPYQGSRDTFSPQNAIASTSGDGMSASQFMGRTSPLLNGVIQAQQQPSTTENVLGALGSALRGFGKSMSGNQINPMQFMQQNNRGAQMLAQLANNPLMYLNNPYLT